MTTTTNVRKKKHNDMIKSDDDIAIRSYKFQLMREAEVLGNQIFKIGLEKALLKRRATESENREREILNLPKIKKLA